MGSPSRINAKKTARKTWVEEDAQQDKNKTQLVDNTCEKSLGEKQGKNTGFRGQEKAPKNPNVGRFDGEAVLRRGVSATEKFSGGTEEAEAEGGAVEDQSRRGVRKLVQRECGHQQVTFCSNPKVTKNSQSNF